MKKNQLEQSHGFYEQLNQVPCKPNMTDHFPVTGDEMYKHHNCRNNLKGIPSQQTHETSQVIVSGEGFDSRDKSGIHYHSRGFQVR